MNKKRNNQRTTYPDFTWLLSRRPQAGADIKGSSFYPEINGIVDFYQTGYGVVVCAKVAGLPRTEEFCSSPIFAFHIHEGESCTGDMNDPFSNALTHYNPYNCPHPYHAGDLPSLFGADGYAFSVFLTDRFSLDEIIGKTVVIHSSLDDFITQPSGNAGMKIACGEIKRRV